MENNIRNQETTPYTRTPHTQKTGRLSTELGPAPRRRTHPNTAASQLHRPQKSKACCLSLCLATTIAFGCAVLLISFTAYLLSQVTELPENTLN